MKKTPRRDPCAGGAGLSAADYWRERAEEGFLPQQHRGDQLPPQSAAARTRAGKRRVMDFRDSGLILIFSALHYCPPCMHIRMISYYCYNALGNGLLSDPRRAACGFSHVGVGLVMPPVR